MARRWAATLAVCCLLLTIAAQPSLASCEGDTLDFIDEMPVAFIGTVTDHREGYARLDIDRVLAGPDLAPTVWVLGGPDQGPWPLRMLVKAGSGVEVTWATGRRYLVLADRDFSTNDCIVRPVSKVDDLAAALPATVRGPVADGSVGRPPPMHDAVASAIFLVVLVPVSLASGGSADVALRRRRAEGHTRRAATDDRMSGRRLRAQVRAWSTTPSGRYRSRRRRRHAASSRRTTA